MPLLPSTLLRSFRWLWGHLTGLHTAPVAALPAAPVTRRGYRIETLRCASADGTRCWRVDFAMPRSPPPPAGFPSFWMLDGQRALRELDDALLDELASRPVPHALVFLDHEPGTAADIPARAQDYTFMAARYPFLAQPGGDQPLGGGADALLEVLERQLWPRLCRRLRLDEQRRSLWGHSLAGLFVMHALMSRTGAFATYAAASPALWWCGGAILDEPLRRFVQHNAGRPARLLLFASSLERCGPPPQSVVADQWAEIAPPPAEAGATVMLATRLRQVPGLQVQCEEFAGLDPSGVFRASLLQSLHRVAGTGEHRGGGHGAGAGPAGGVGERGAPGPARMTGPPRRGWLLGPPAGLPGILVRHCRACHIRSLQDQ